MGTHWSVAFKSFMEFHSTRSLEVGSWVHVVPPAHRGSAEIVPLQRSSTGALFFVHQRQKFTVSATGKDGAPDSYTAGGRTYACIGSCQPLLCPTNLPLEKYASSDGLSDKQVHKLGLTRPDPT